MGRRTGYRPSRRPRTRPARRPGGLALALVVALLVGAGLVVLERRGALPESVAVVVRQVEPWLAPVLAELGLEPPSPKANEAPAPPPTSSDQPAVIQALALLDRIPVEPERGAGYDRENWPHWLDLDGDCMNARHEVLAAESLLPPTLSTDGCDVVSGLWRDAYTGETFRDPSDLDVDHFVPLAEAHRSGGHTWDQERRVAYANDVEDSRALIAVNASANRSKSDQGPEEWLPPDPAYRCRYAADWVAVKARWSLSMDERERVTVGNLLQGCASG